MLVEDNMRCASGRITILVRVRPLLRGEKRESGVAIPSEQQIIVASGSYKFDHVFQGPQELSFQSVSNTVEGFLSGHSTTLIAYGHTTSGKTYTLLGGSPSYRPHSDLSKHRERGILPRFFDYIFSLRKCKLRVSYYEIYNERVFDLLDLAEIRGVDETLKQLKKVEVCSVEQAYEWLGHGLNNRQTNSCLSKTHTVFQIEQGSTCFKVVDLAGSERK